jgi:hypothetical protein
MSREGWPFFPLTESRFSEPDEYNSVRVKVCDAITLYYGKQPNVGWRFVVKQDGYRMVGQIYKTKAELLADIERYAKSWGFGSFQSESTKCPYCGQSGINFDESEMPSDYCHHDT